MKIKALKSKLIVSFIFFIFIFLVWSLKLPCIYRYFLGISCPGCGMTRAFFSCLQLNFKSAFSHHPMIFSMPLLYIYFLTDGHLFGKKADNAILIFIAIGFILNWMSNFISFC